eukprot:2810530-Lingulodinium_polyedra.AAC.1
MKAIDVLWVSMHGPPKELITDSDPELYSPRRRGSTLRAKEPSCTPAQRASTPSTPSAEEHCC